MKAANRLASNFALREFEGQLKELLGQPTDLRPFVCDGSPLDCSVFIIGFNPATTMSQDFWQFWKPGQGFDKEAWLAAYKRHRETRPLRPGQKRRNPVSYTRRVIEWIIEEAHPVRCLETNIYAAATEKAADLTSKVTAPFDFLLRTIKPRLLVTHGAEASDYLGRRELDVPLVAKPHFSRGWSEADARALGRWIKQTTSGS